MTLPPTRQRVPRPLRRDAAAHLFALGQAVQLKRGFARQALPADIYRITGRLPQAGGSPQYRIRNDDERHERVTTQDDLEPVRDLRSGDNETLIERTFGNGQRTETQQPRNQETEAGKGAPEA